MTHLHAPPAPRGQSGGITWSAGALPIYAHRDDPPAGYHLAASFARPLVRSLLSSADALVSLTLYVADHCADHPHPDAVTTRLIWYCRDTADAARLDRDRAECFIQQTIRELCRTRAPGEQILAAARQANRGTFTEPELLALCRGIARQSIRRRRG